MNLTPICTFGDFHGGLDNKGQLWCTLKNDILLLILIEM